jgi:CheY-like chemotaxis protein
VRNDHLDAQTSARLLKRALAIKRSRENLADALGVHPKDLELWLGGQAFPPEPVFESVLEIILDGKNATPGGTAQAQGAKRRVLIADNVEGSAAVARILGEEFALVPVHTLTEGLDLLQTAVAVPRLAIDAIVCGQHFEGSQMLRFLECVKAYKPTMAIPFICCRALPSQLSESALSAMREACEALGAVAYIDLPELQQRAGAEKAAVEFRDAVRAAVRVKSAERALRILVVDDNADAAHTLMALLRMVGHDAHKAGSGEEALRVGAQLTPDAAILDIGMSGMSGYELAERIRQMPWGEQVLLIAVTGRDVAPGSAFARHFTKPLAVEQLLEALRGR